MFVGHYSVSFAGKAAEPRVPLWLLFVAVQFVDVLWAIFVLLGIEKVRIVPGITASNALDLYYMPYTHSLVGAIGWSLLAFVVCQWIPTLRGKRTGLIVALAIFSHWVLDLIVHRPDLPVYDSTFKMGFALWNYRMAAFVVELVVFLGGAALYLRAATRKGRIAMFVLVLVVVHVYGAFFFPPPPSDRAMALTALLFYAVLAFLAWWADPRQQTQVQRS